LREGEGEDRRCSLSRMKTDGRTDGQSFYMTGANIPSVNFD